MSNKKNKKPELKIPKLDISGALSSYITPIQEAQFYMTGKSSTQKAKRPGLDRFLGDGKFGSQSRKGSSAPVNSSKKQKPSPKKVKSATPKLR